LLEQALRLARVAGHTLAASVERAQVAAAERRPALAGEPLPGAHSTE
jgi:hypothetical protein